MRRVPKTTYPDGRNNTKENYEEARKVRDKNIVISPEERDKSEEHTGERTEV